jgi:hypothetical protein
VSAPESRLALLIDWLVEELVREIREEEGGADTEAPGELAAESEGAAEREHMGSANDGDIVSASADARGKFEIKNERGEDHGP